MAELQQCGADSADSRAQNLSKLFSILEQHQAALVNQDALPSSRINCLTRHAEIALVPLRHEWPLLLIVLVYMDLVHMYKANIHLLVQWYIFQQLHRRIDETHSSMKRGTCWFGFGAH